MNPDKWIDYVNFCRSYRDESGSAVHHIVMVSINEKLKDDPNNLVRMHNRDHIRCHRYLVECGAYEKDSEEYYKAVQAYKYICGKYKHLITQDEYDYAQSLQIGLRIPEYVRQRISETLTGRTLSEETRKKMRDNHPDFSGENHPMFGKHFSAETRKKMSESKTGSNHPMYGKHHSDETRKKMSEALIGKKHPSMSGRKYMTDGVLTARVPTEKTQSYLDQGWWYGKSPKVV